MQTRSDPLRPLVLLARPFAREVRFLRAEKAILRPKVKGRVHLIDPERSTLIRFGKDLGKSTVKKLISIVRPETYARWLRKQPPPRPKTGPGPPRKPIEVRELVVRIARQCGYGMPSQTDEIVKPRQERGFQVASV